MRIPLSYIIYLFSLAVLFAFFSGTGMFWWPTFLFTFPFCISTVCQLSVNVSIVAKFFGFFFALKEFLSPFHAQPTHRHWVIFIWFVNFLLRLAHWTLFCCCCHMHFNILSASNFMTTKLNKNYELFDWFNAAYLLSNTCSIFCNQRVTLIISFVLHSLFSIKWWHHLLDEGRLIHSLATAHIHFISQQISLTMSLIKIMFTFHQCQSFSHSF